MRHVSVHTALAFALLAGAPAIVHAQRRDSTTTRDSITRRDRPLPPVVVTGTLTPTTPRLLAASVATVPTRALEAEPMRSAIAQLRRVTGVYIDEANGPLGPTVIRLRGGEEPFTQILVDGVQVNENGGFFDAQGITLVNVDRIEVARGPQSTVYGTSAMSGAVQILSRVGAPGAPQFDATIEGSRSSPHGGSRRGFVQSRGGGDVLRYSAGLGRTYDRGIYAVPNDLHVDDAALRLDVVPSSTFELSGTARYMGVSSNLPVRDPGTSRAPLDPNSRQGRNRLLGSLDATWSATPRWTNKLSVASYQIVFTYDNAKDVIDTTRYRIGFFNANYHYHSVVQRTTARYVSTVSSESGRPVTWSAAFGGAWENENLETEASGDFGPSTLSVSRPSVAAFTEGQLRAGDRFTLLGGARVERFRGVGTALVPRATATYDLVRGLLTLRGAAAGAYKAPNLLDQFVDPGFFVGNPDLKPETSRSAELGVDVHRGDVTASVTTFRQRYDDIVRVVPYETNKSIKANVGRIRASGLEVEASYVPRPRWLATANASWVATEVADNRGLNTRLYPNGEPLPFRPAYTASAMLGAPVTSVLSMVVRLSGIGRQTVLSERFNGTRVSIDPFTVLDATATYAATQGLDVYARAENAFNNAFSMAYDKPGAPRSIAVGVRVRR